MGRLPQELLDLIVGQLDAEEDLSNIRLVSSSMAKLVEPRLFRTVDAGFPLIINEQVKQRLRAPRLLQYARSFAFDTSITGQYRCSKYVDFEEWYDKVVKSRTGNACAPGLQSDLSEPEPAFKKHASHAGPKPAEDCSSWLHSEDEAFRVIFGRRLQDLFSEKGFTPQGDAQHSHSQLAWQKWRGFWISERDKGYQQTAIDDSASLFRACPGIDSVIMAARGHHFRSIPCEDWYTDQFDLQNPHICRYASDRIKLKSVLQWVIECKTELKHLTVHELDHGDLADPDLTRRVKDVFPRLETLRLHIDLYTASSIDGMLSLPLLINSTTCANLTTLKLVFEINEVCSAPFLCSYFEDLLMPNLETLYLSQCALRTAILLGFLQRHRSSLRDLCFSGMPRRLYSQSRWKPILLGIRDMQLATRRCRMVAPCGWYFTHSLVINGTFEHLPNETVDLFFDYDNFKNRCIHITDAGTTITYGPEYKGLEYEYPEPWTIHRDDVFDDKFVAECGNEY